MLESESRLVSHGQSRPCPLVSHYKLYNGLDCILGSRPTHIRLYAPLRLTDGVLSIDMRPNGVHGTWHGGRIQTAHAVAGLVRGGIARAACGRARVICGELMRHTRRAHTHDRLCFPTVFTVRDRAAGTTPVPRARAAVGTRRRQNACRLPSAEPVCI